MRTLASSVVGVALLAVAATSNAYAAALAQAKGGMADPGGLTVACLAPKPLAKPVTLKYAMATAVEFYSTPMLAEALGELAAENLKVTPIFLQSAESIQAIGNGELDVVYASTAQPFLNSVAAKVDIKVVLPGFIAVPEAAGFFARKDLFADPSKPDIKVLKGKIAAFPGGVNSFSAFAMSETLAKANMTVDDLQIVNIQTADNFLSLETGAVQAAVLFPPYVEKANSSGKYVRLGGIPDLYPTASYYFGKNLLKGDREVGVAFVRAILRTQLKYLGPDYRKDETVVNTLAKIMKVDPATVKVGNPNIHSYRFDEKMFDPVQNFYLSRAGQLRYKTALPFAELADVEFLKSATASCPR